MTEHSFGPIENQLIVGYYKRGFIPLRALPKLKFKDVRVDRGELGALTSLLQPVFYGWSPANGNSSSHDFRVTYESKAAPKQDLLSRGLGYRITFIRDPDILRGKLVFDFRAVFEMTDFWSSKVLAREEFIETYSEKIPRPSGGPSILKLMDEFGEGELVLEVSPLHTTIIKNNGQQYVLTTYSPPESPIFQDSKKVFESLKEVIGPRISLKEPAQRPQALLLILKNYKQTIAFIRGQKVSIHKSNKQKLRNHLTLSTVAFCKIVKFLNEMTKLSDRFILDANAVQTEMKKWLDDVGPFPSNLTVEFVDTVLEKATQVCSDPTRKIAWGSLVDKQNWWQRIEMTDLKLLDSWFEFLVEAATKKEISRQSENISIRFKTKNTSLEFNPQNFKLHNIESSEVCANFHRRPSFQIVILRSKLLPNPSAHLIPNSDVFLLPRFKNSKPNPVFLDLQDLRYDKWGELDPNLKSLREQDESDNFCVSKSGILISDWRTKDQTGLFVYFIPFGASMRELQGEPDTWAVIFLNPFQPTPSVFLSVPFQSKENANLFVTATSSVNMAPRGRHVYLACLQFDQAQNRLQVISELTTPTQNETPVIPKMAWIQSKTKHVYPCWFHSEGVLGIWVYFNNKFVPLATEFHRSHILNKLNKRVEKWSPVNEFSKPVGVFAVKKQRREADGYDVYRVGRLYFKY